MIPSHIYITVIFKYIICGKKKEEPKQKKKKKSQ